MAQAIQQCGVLAVLVHELAIGRACQEDARQNPVDQGKGLRLFMHACMHSLQTLASACVASEHAESFLRVSSRALSVLQGRVMRKTLVT